MQRQWIVNQQLTGCKEAVKEDKVTVTPEEDPPIYEIGGWWCLWMWHGGRRGQEEKRQRDDQIDR